MKNQTETFLTPVGRMVMGSLYDPQTKSMDGKPLTFQSGRNEGKPRVNYFFALAIKKNGETHWNQTEWGAKIYGIAQKLFPNGEINRPTFAWKIIDGDSTIPTGDKGNRPCDNIGFPGHWVLKFGSAFAPALIDRNREYLTKEGAINCGDYIQVNVQINSNKSRVIPNLGLALNAIHVALIGYGEPIEFKKAADPKTLNISTQLPPGASETPVAFKTETAIPAPVLPGATTALAPPPPYPQILNQGKKMTAQAPGTYEQMKQAGWTDEQLVQHGMMTL